MGKHSNPDDMKSSYGQTNGSKQSDGYQPKHSATAGSDVPPRGEGIDYDNTKGSYVVRS